MNYERALRAIGEWADARHPRHVRLIELAEGFAFQWSWGGSSTAYLKTFLGPELVVMHRRPHPRRPVTSLANRIIRSPGSQDSFRNVLRAIGHEMDAAGARELLVEAVDEGILVTFQYQAPGEDTRWHKHMSMLTSDDCAALVDEAQARREVKMGLAARLL